MSRRVLLDRRQSVVVGAITGTPANQTAISIRDDLEVVGSVASSAPIEWVYSQDDGASWTVFDPEGKVRDIFWKIDYFNNFDAALGSEWLFFDAPGHAGNGIRRPEQVTISGGNLVITGISDVTDGVKSGGVEHTQHETFAKYRVFMRADLDPSLTFSALALTWDPDNGNFPVPVPGGEIDFVEMLSSDADTRLVKMFVHGNIDGQNDIVTPNIYAGTIGEFSTEFICERSPGRIDFYRDGYGGPGTYIASVTESPSTPTPKGPMHVAFQLDAFKPTYSGSPVAMQVGYYELSKLHNAPVQVRARLVGNPSITSNTATVTLQGASSQVEMLSDFPSTSNRDAGGTVSLTASWTPACSFQVQERANSQSAWSNSSGTGSTGFGSSTTFGNAIAAIDDRQYRIKLTSGGYVYTSSTTVFDVAGPVDPVSSPRGRYFSSSGSSHTFDEGDFVDRNGVPVTLEADDMILFVAAAPGPSEVATPNFTFSHGTSAFSAPANNFRPALRGYEYVYTGSPTTWTISSSNTNIRVMAIAYKDTVELTFGSPVYDTSPVDPPGLVNIENSHGTAITSLNFTGSSVSAPPAGHQTLLNTGLGVRQLYAADMSLSAAGVYNPAAATVSPGAEQATSIAVVASPVSAPVGGGGISPPTLPTFNAGDHVVINVGDNVASVVSASLPGKHFLFDAGTHVLNDVRPKSGHHFWGPVSGLATFNGTGIPYCFRAGANGSSDGVFIGRNIKIQNYGVGNSRAEYGAIQAQPTNTVGGEYTYGHADNWFIYDVELANNSSNGIRMSDNCIVYQCWAYGHSVTGFGSDRGVGGLIYDCLLEANGLNPATGSGANGANIKITWHNADEGRTAIVPAAYQRTKAVMRVVETTFNATKSGITGTCEIGLWYDLDCQNIEVLDCEFNNHTHSSVFFEGCNGGLVQNNIINNSDGYGPAYGTNFINGGLACGESTNIVFDGNTLTGCDYALVNRMSNRTADWINGNNSSFVNFGWPTASGGVRYWLTYGSPTPVPTTSQRSNVWTGNNVFKNNVLVSCGRVVINEGTNGGGQNAQGSTPVATIQFINNDYSGSPGILFYHLSNTSMNLAAWQALPYDRDQ